MFLHERLEHVHKENPEVDFMHKLRAIIEATTEDDETPNLATMDVENDPDLLRARHNLMAENIEKEINNLEYEKSLPATILSTQLILHALLDLIQGVRKEREKCT